jgi:hypothetical protein
LPCKTRIIGIFFRGWENSGEITVCIYISEALEDERNFL